MTPRPGQAVVPIEPRLMKGALVVFETRLPVPTNLIVFQYNPHTLSRSMRAAGGDPGDAWTGDELRGGDADTAPEPATQSFGLTIELDATDRLEHNDPATKAVGLHGRLAQLELLLYPPSAVVILNELVAAIGSANVTPPDVPKVMFFWGPGRVLPVRVTSVEIEEQEFDQRLNPIRATAQVGLRTVTESELCAWGPPFDAVGVAGHVAKEALARAAAARTIVETERQARGAAVGLGRDVAARITGALPF